MDQQVNIELFKVDPSDFKKIRLSKSINGGCASITFMTQISTNKKVVLKQYEIRRSSNLFYQAVKTHAICQHKGIIDFDKFKLIEPSENYVLKTCCNFRYLQFHL